jgi:hypothetical protein
LRARQPPLSDIAHPLSLTMAADPKAAPLAEDLKEFALYVKI